MTQTEIFTSRFHVPLQIVPDLHKLHIYLDPLGIYLWVIHNIDFFEDLDLLDSIQEMIQEGDIVFYELLFVILPDFLVGQRFGLKIERPVTYQFELLSEGFFR